MTTPTPSPSADLIDAYLAYLRMLGRSDNTIDARRYWLSRADAELKFGLDQANRDELAGWVYQDRWSAQTRATILSALRGAYSYWEGRYLDSDPTTDLPRPKVPDGIPRPVTDDELTHILTHARQPIWLWSLLAAYEGARCIEISRMSKSDITPDVTYLHGKGAKPRAVPTHPDVWEATRGLPDGPITPENGQRLTPRQISTRAAQYFARTLEMPGVHLHRLRHWYLTQAHRATGDIRVTQQLAGHASPKTTAIYTQVASSDMQRAVMALPRVSTVRRTAGVAPDVTDPGLARVQ